MGTLFFVTSTNMGGFLLGGSLKKSMAKTTALIFLNFSVIMKDTFLVLIQLFMVMHHMLSKIL